MNRIHYGSILLLMVTCNSYADKRGVALLCPPSSALRVVGYVPSVIADNMASSITITAQSPYGFNVEGRLDFAHSRTFDQIKKELEENSFLLEESNFDYITKTVECAYKVGRNTLYVSNEKKNITACPPLKDFIVHPGIRYLSIDLFKKTIEVPNKKKLFRQFSNGKKVPFEQQGLDNIMNNEALVQDDGLDSYIMSDSLEKIVYNYPLTLGEFHAMLRSTVESPALIEAELCDYELTSMSQEKSNKKNQSVVSCSYTHKKNGKTVTATIEIPGEGMYVKGEQLDCSIFVSEKNVPK